MSSPELSFITVNYNGVTDTIELINCIQSVVHSIAYEIIVVDNGSTANEAEQLRCLFPTVKCIRSETNLGFAGGNNLGIERSEGDYLFFINNDTLIEDDNLSHLIERLASNPTWGASSPKICFNHSPRLIQYPGFPSLSRTTLRTKGIGFNDTYTQQ